MLFYLMMCLGTVFCWFYNCTVLTSGEHFCLERRAGGVGR